jgi:hypothetical protein
LKINIIKIFSLSVVLSILLAFGCTEPPTPTLNSKERRLVDSLYKDSIQVLRPFLDSLCDLNFDGDVAFAVDSMMEIRLAEIRKQLARISQLKRQN